MSERVARERFAQKVCNGTLTLRQAQRLELAYKRAQG